MASEHPNYPGKPFPEAVIRQTIGDVLGALRHRLTQPDRFDAKQFEALLLQDAMNAAMPSLLQLLPEELVIVIAEGIARSLIASLDRTLKRDDAGVAGAVQ